MDLVAAKAARAANTTDWFRVARCDFPREVVGVVREVAAERRSMISTLDFYDHGESGHLRMGSDTLFSHRGTGRMIARMLRPLLAPDARVRLLGCNCAVGQPGRDLLLMLHEEFGPGVAVFGAIRPIDADDFPSGIFDRLEEEVCLFSSTEAASRIAPDIAARNEEVAVWCAAVVR
jgi:hypothetical protein